MQAKQNLKLLRFLIFSMACAVMMQYAEALNSGTWTVMVVQINALDGHSDPRCDDYAMNALMWDANEWTVSSQISDCSSTKLQLIPFAGGVQTVSVPINAAVSSSYQVLWAASQELQMKFNVSTISDLADRFIFNAPVSLVMRKEAFRTGKSTFYKWCANPGLIIHELSHTMGLAHAWKDGTEYRDITSHLGGNSRTLKRCYNGGNFHFLQWFSNREVRIDPFQGALVNLATFVDYSKTSSDEPVLVSIPLLGAHLIYNRAKDHNAEVGLARDQVTLVYGRQLTSFKGSTDPTMPPIEIPVDHGVLVIDACERIDGNSSNPDIMVVSIMFNQTLCGTT